MSHPLISVTIPSFNQGKSIEQTILSVIGQRYPNLELFVIDGGSSDNTVDILRKYSDVITYWHSRKDNGQADAINQGMSMSSGKILCWLNSDDMFLPGTLLNISEMFKGRIDSHYLIYGGSISMSEVEGKLWSFAQAGEAFNAERLSYFDYIVQPSAFWTRSLWEASGSLDTRYNYVLDWEWFLRAAQLTDFEYFPRFLSIYRLHQSHKSSFGGHVRRQEIRDVVKKYSSEYWIDLYSVIEQRFDEIMKISTLLGRCRIPKKDLLLPFFSFKVMSHLRDIRDFLTVFYMYLGTKIPD